MKTKVAVGCGKRFYGDDWLHVDGGNYSHLDFAEVNCYPLNDQSVELIFASHLIAYFSQDEFKGLLGEWKRVLKPGGILRIATPDFAKMSALYQKGKIDLKDILGPIYGRMKMGDETIYHKTCYDHMSLRAILESAGFSDIQRYDWRQTEHANIDDHSQAYLCAKGDKENGVLISLNVQCTKP